MGKLASQTIRATAVRPVSLTLFLSKSLTDRESHKLLSTVSKSAFISIVAKAKLGVGLTELCFMLKRISF